MHSAPCPGSVPGSALLGDDPLLIQSPGLGTLTSVASTSHVGPGS